MNLRFTPRATRDLIDIADYIRERAPAASLRVRSAILVSLRNLAQLPACTDDFLRAWRRSNR